MSDATLGAVPSAIERLAPYVTARRDRVLPVVIGVSLFVHATVFLPSLFHRDAHEGAKQEIPVEIVQLPPEPKKAPAPKPAPKPPEQKAAAKQQPKPAEQKVAQKPQPKPQQPKPQQPKPQQPKPQQTKPQQPTGEQRMKQLLGPMPAIALPGAAANGDDVVDYSQLVLSKVAKAKSDGPYHGIPAASSVAFTLGDAGELVDVHIVRASGDATLDDEAIAMVRRGAPYPPPPPGGRREYAITLCGGAMNCHDLAALRGRGK